MYIVAWVVVDKSTEPHKLIDKYLVFIDDNALTRARTKYEQVRIADDTYTANLANVIETTDYPEESFETGISSIGVDKKFRRDREAITLESNY